jgi:hypothetical protein
MKISESDSDTSLDTSSSDSDTAEAEVSQPKVKESDIPPSQSSNISPKPSNIQYFFLF